MKVAEMERTGMAALVGLMDTTGVIQLESALEGRVTEECLSMYNVDGPMRKTAKSKLLDLFNIQAIGDRPHEYISLIDMGLMWRLATPTSEDREAIKRDGGVYRWSDYLNKICAIVLS